ncbi:hypothetical protein UCRNP2_6942 [Neofusicoccum parvum UCRNP2]|uniref:Uncharacterized protein n=2 Tax=Neofusicoccum parvum TaxID=310453 RepID=R1GJY2_BOTPV|nr:hypothetical protein UCRNP2_6942 [Neofusicoccum parvum UCRNP2]GME35277.1 hypothetical protein GTA08_BOTSDO12332 [Neofusicoccum parvum]
MSDPPPTAPPAVALHAPLTTAASPSAVATTQPPPAPAWLQGKWHVTHSTLPMWRSKRNVSITYTPLPDSSPPKIDDLVEYQGLDADKLKTVHGVDTPVPDAHGWAWDWRGKGWLVIASSRWEVLGYGDEDEASRDAGAAQTQAANQRQWVVTYFAKTLFTPAGIDLYSRHKDGLRSGTVEAIKKALAGMEDEGMRKLAEGLFEVKLDDARKD